MAEKTVAQRLTGSTGDAQADTTPRTAFMGLATGAAALGCYAFSTDATLTALVMGVTTNGAFLSLCLFDIFRPK